MKRIGAILGGLLALGWAASALAHAEPATAQPGDGAVLLSSPPSVVLEMSQDMARQENGNDIDVLDASGKEVTTAPAVVDNQDRKKLSVSLPANLPAGKYTVKWKTLSADDGDPATGSISFTIDPNGTPTPGKEQLREDLLGGQTPAPPASGDNTDVSIGGGADNGMSWVLVVAVGLGALVLGAGGTFLLVQKQ